MSTTTATVWICDTCQRRFLTERGMNIHDHHIHGMPSAAETRHQRRERLLAEESVD